MLEVIYLTRHGFRSNWTTNPTTGAITSPLPTPTGIPSDPSLALHGVHQARQLTAHLLTLSPPPARLYTSPFYRCCETLAPLATALSLPLLPEPGLGEWYGRARFSHPVPASAPVLKRFFPQVDAGYEPKVVPGRHGESVQELHERVARTVEELVRECDAIGVSATVWCTHAATNIAAGRALTGEMEREVRTGTCSLGVYVRCGEGALGVWRCVRNGDCGFLEGGEERNWGFDGEEAWDFPTVETGGEGGEGEGKEGEEGGGEGEKVDAKI